MLASQERDKVIQGTFSYIMGMYFVTVRLQNLRSLSHRGVELEQEVQLIAARTRRGEGYRRVVKEIIKAGRQE
jgi:hypothetical protein